MKLLLWLPELTSGFGMHARSSPFGQIAGDCATGGGRSHAAVRPRPGHAKVGAAQVENLRVPTRFVPQAACPDVMLSATACATSIPSMAAE